MPWLINKLERPKCQGALPNNSNYSQHSGLIVGLPALRTPLQPLAPARDRLDLVRGEVGGEMERERAA